MLKIKKIKPMFTGILTTMHKYTVEEATTSGIIDASKLNAPIKEYQEVLAVGSSVTGVKVGDLVCINPSRYKIMKHKEGSLKDGVITDNPVIGYNFNVIEVDGKQCLYLQNNDIDYIIEDWEEVEDTDSGVIHPNTDIII